MSTPTSADICWTPAVEVARLVRSGEVSPTEVAEAAIDRIAQVNPELNALVEHDPDRVRTAAAELDAAVVDGRSLGPLHGVPFTLKEPCRLEGTAETGGLVAAKGTVSTTTEVVAQRLLDAGGLFLGKTNLVEAGYCARSGNHLYGNTHNAWKQGRSAGGSSSGAGAAVASGLGPLALGSDGGGSVRLPAAMNGIVGMKPGVGCIPQTITPLRHITFLGFGPMSRTVADAALMLDVMTGADSSDPLSRPGEGGQFLQATEEEPGELRIAWSPNLGFEPSGDPEIVQICERAVGAFEELGCQVEEADPGWENPEEAMWKGLHAAAYSTMYGMLDWSQYAGEVDEQFVQVMREGSELSAVDILTAEEARGRLWERFAAFMGDYDLLVCPTITTRSFPVDAFCPPELDGEPLRRQLLGWTLTYPVNMLSTPAISVPAGFDSDDMPVGLQLIGRLHGEADLLRAAAAFEAVRPWADRRPAR